MESGGDLFSRAVSSQVPSALKGLTSVFGMGTGGTPSPLPPEIVALLGLRTFRLVSCFQAFALPLLFLRSVSTCPRLLFCLFGKSSSSQNEPSPSGCLSFLPSGLLTLSAALPAHQVQCVLRSRASVRPLPGLPSAYPRPLSHLDNRT